MTLSEAQNNELWAKQIVDHLVDLGVTYFCIAPGSRSSALTLAAANHPQVETLVHFDERGMAFHGLGYGKAILKPAAIIVTSGTAVGNLFPAVMEASIARIPLILLTSDRPPELRDCGANQTADQVKLFGDYVRWQVDLPCFDEKLKNGYLSSILSYAVFISRHSPSGPVQINCMFREPLFSMDKTPLEKAALSCHYEPSFPVCSQSTLQTLAKKLSSYSSGMIVVGSLSSQEDAAAIAGLAKAMKWPVICDITSQMRIFSDEPCCISYFDSIVKNAPSSNVDCVLHLGDRIVSKTLSEWISKQSPDYYLVADHPDRYDPKAEVQYRVQCQLTWFCKEITPYIDTQTSTILSLWQSYSEEIKKEITHQLADQNTLSEPGIFFHLSDKMPSHWNLFLSNSMPVRDADSFFFPKRYTGKVFVNRGVSGIDGNISTAAGIAAALKSPLVAALGDLAFLHDMNSILQVVKSPIPVILLVINNGGGGIFSFLPISGKTEIFEEYVATAHNLQLEKIADFAGLEFCHPQNREEFFSLWQNLSDQPRSCLIEITTDRQENFLLHQHLHQSVKERLCLQLAPTAQ